MNTQEDAMIEINLEELETISGANPLAVALAVIAVYDAASDFIEGFQEGYAGK